MLLGCTMAAMMNDADGGVHGADIIVHMYACVALSGILIMIVCDHW